ncbi:hypothetical protein [Phyllobacterium sp. UNC302MFCol5.2]|uniref:hypothetical protein n=1 Tax=Phyllobacterium sp. UNC302MFCol5.2 TaxID=1449065 RepID=UPI0004832DD1|nr:hypothetical protein [Phyllobacterium sp. UNC302MFCol5.2]
MPNEAFPARKVPVADPHAEFRVNSAALWLRRNGNLKTMEALNACRRRYGLSASQFFEAAELAREMRNLWPPL